MRARAALLVAVAIGAGGAALGTTAACTSDSGSSTSGTSGASGTSGTSCPDDLPSACPTVAPSYTKDVAPVIQQACTPCHAPGGEQASRPLVTYAGAFANRSAMLNQVHACRMPPSDAPPLSTEGRSVLQTWVVCGAPNN